MILAPLIGAGGLALLGAIVASRAVDAADWQNSLVAYALYLPANLKTDDVARWLGMIAAATQAPRAWSLLPMPPFAIEVVATADGITHYLLAPENQRAKLLGSIRAGLPGARLEDAPDFLKTAPDISGAAEGAASSRRRPMAVDRAEATSTAFLASLQPLRHGEEIRFQIIMTSAGTPPPVHSASSNPEDRWWAAYLMEGEATADADAVRAARAKQKEPLLQVSMRLGVKAPTSRQTRFLLARTWSTLAGENADGVRLFRRLLPSPVVAARLINRRLPLTAWPLLLNVRELAGLIGFPIGGMSLPGLILGAARQLAPSPQTPAHGTIFADSNYPGMQRPLAISALDRLKHTYLLGPTGVGKSTLIANMTLQDVDSGAGVALIDPKNDLVTDVLARIPEQRRQDVIVLNPAATDRPIGFNLLGGLRIEHDREMAVDHVVHIMSSLWHDSWGPRSNDIVSNALLTLTHTSAPDGSAFTLVEVPELLTNPAFRRFVVTQRSMPAVARPFWSAYDQMSDSERNHMIAAPMNKLRALTSRSSLRLLLGQSEGIDVADVLRKQKILLMPLSEGVLGAGTSQLLGALLLSSLVRATFARANVPPEQRRPAFIVADEFQNVLRLPLGITDMLAMARGYGVGMTLAHQYLGQLSESVKSAVLGTARTSVVFQLDYADARTMATRFGPLTADDLMGLQAHEVAMRLSVGTQTQRPVTGATRPLPDVITNADALAAESRERFGVPRAEVEAAIQARITPPGSPGTNANFGRKRRGGTT